jgi:transcription antitermination protein NusB
MGQRRRSREIALQILYRIDMTECPPDEAIALHYELITPGTDHEVQASLLVRPFAEHLVRGVYLHQAEIDQIIVSASDHWRLDRMSLVDRNILRIALFEMLYCPDVPPKVSINEAIDIGKKFGSEDSGAFINGVLDHIMGKHQKADQTSAPSAPSGTQP